MSKLIHLIMLFLVLLRCGVCYVVIVESFDCLDPKLLACHVPRSTNSHMSMAPPPNSQIPADFAKFPNVQMPLVGLLVSEQRRTTLRSQPDPYPLAPKDQIHSFKKAPCCNSRESMCNVDLNYLNQYV